MSKSFDELIAVMSRLRAPGGCPWDAEQTYGSLSQYLLEEAYETFDAIHGAEATGDTEHLSEELGDLLLQVVVQRSQSLVAPLPRHSNVRVPYCRDHLSMLLPP